MGLAGSAPEYKPVLGVLISILLFNGFLLIAAAASALQILFQLLGSVQICYTFGSYGVLRFFVLSFIANRVEEVLDSAFVIAKRLLVVFVTILISSLEETYVNRSMLERLSGMSVPFTRVDQVGFPDLDLPAFNVCHLAKRLTFVTNSMAFCSAEPLDMANGYKDDYLPISPVSD